MTADFTNAGANAAMDLVRIIVIAEHRVKHTRRVMVHSVNVKAINAGKIIATKLPANVMDG